MASTGRIMMRAASPPPTAVVVSRITPLENVVSICRTGGIDQGASSLVQSFKRAHQRFTVSVMRLDSILAIQLIIY